MASGYTSCACRDCFDLAISDDEAVQALCVECEEAGCERCDCTDCGDRSHGCQREDFGADGVELTVIVGNVGTVYTGFDSLEAGRVFDDYVARSKSGVGRAAGESVTLCHLGEPAMHFDGEPAAVPVGESWFLASASSPDTSASFMVVLQWRDGSQEISLGRFGALGWDCAGMGAATVTHWRALPMMPAAVTL